MTSICGSGVMRMSPGRSSMAEIQLKMEAVAMMNRIAEAVEGEAIYPGILLSQRAVAEAAARLDAATRLRPRMPYGLFAPRMRTSMLGNVRGWK